MSANANDIVGERICLPMKEIASALKGFTAGVGLSASLEVLEIPL